MLKRLLAPAMLLPTIITFGVLTPSAAYPQAAAGTYLYTKLPVVGLAEARAVAFHPDGSYAVVLESTNRVQIVDWASRSTVTHDLTPASGNVFWEDLLFDPGGGFALLVGYEFGAVTEGVVFRLDDALYRSGGSTSQIFSELPSLRAAGLHTGIERPWNGGLPVLLSRNDAGTFAQLREVDTATGDFGSLNTATASAAGCDDLAFADNELGDPGVLVVCGTNGADSLFYTEVGGVGEWRTNLGNNNHGNTNSSAAHAGGDYALVVSWSGRRLLRFEGGVLTSSADSIWFPTKGIFHAAFAPGGARALIVGRAAGTPLSATVLEYRHDLFSASEVTDASIPNFDSPPYLGSSNTWLLASAWRPGCEGGLIVGGESDFQGSTGQLIEFSLEGGASCDASTAVPTLAPGTWLALLALLGWVGLRGRTRHSIA